MNSEPNVQDLPSRDDVIRFLGRQRSRIAAVYDADGKQVHLGGRQAPLPDAPITPDTSRHLRCAVCDAPAGEVTLMKVVAESKLALAVAEALGKPIEGYICYGGDHAGQRGKAMLRPFVKANNAIRPVRKTKKGHAMQWLTDSDGKVNLTYARTSRSHRTSKARKAIQKASRRANRG